MSTLIPFQEEINDMEAQRIVFNSDPQNLSAIEKLVEQVCNEMSIDENHYGNIMVALSEAVNNAILHGNKSDQSKKVDVSFIPVAENKIEFVVKDEGPGFDFTNLPDPTAPENIEKENGRGIFLMKNLADQLDFTDQGRAVKLTFFLSKN
jgi:serine/threonine-protein kinase RsbW